MPAKRGKTDKKRQEEESPAKQKNTSGLCKQVGDT